MARKLRKIDVSAGIFWVEAPDAGVYVLCGSPGDVVKHMMRRGLIVEIEIGGTKCETGPNCILLSDVSIQSGHFCNLTEFPILQMLYRQGMILPGHPNNTGQKPLLIGIREQLASQLEYIHRGNYGLISEQEIMETGIDRETAREMMALKTKFSFGRIMRPEELIDTRVVEDKRVEIKNGVFVERLGLNRYEFVYQDERVTVDLSLQSSQIYQSPYPLGFHDIKRSYFSIVHSGDGDGWDTNRPCMSSVICFQGKIYLIDAGPNLPSILNGLGVGVNEIEGIFHTHGHDDHFAGLTTLMRADRRIKYFSTPLVRASVTKKFCALLDIDEDDFPAYFDVQNLAFDEWNDIGGLQVRPVFSPHPVETSFFYFRAFGDDGYRTYAHLADIASFTVMNKMLEDDANGKGISEDFVQRTKSEYLTAAHVKKIDIGGGLIHGEALDFAQDESDKLILCHIAREFTQDEKNIGEGAPFGTVDELIPTYQDYVRRSAYEYVTAHFPKIPEFDLRPLLNRPVKTFNPESILLRAGEVPKNIYLILTGNVEFVDRKYELDGMLSAGSFLGELPGLDSRESMRTYRAASFVNALSFPRQLYANLIERHNISKHISQLIQKRYFLQHTRMFGDSLSSPVQERIANLMTARSLEKGGVLGKEEIYNLFMVKSGSLAHMLGEERISTVKIGDVVGIALATNQQRGATEFVAETPVDFYEIPIEAIEGIPIVRWKLFEACRRNMLVIRGGAE
ncbi:MAG: cyclic nucleotide-binding domain-containing protein [Rhodospirillales bacterium]